MCEFHLSSLRNHYKQQHLPALINVTSLPVMATSFTYNLKAALIVRRVRFIVPFNCAKQVYTLCTHQS